MINYKKGIKNMWRQRKLRIKNKQKVKAILKDQRSLLEIKKVDKIKFYQQKLKMSLIETT